MTLPAASPRTLVLIDGEHYPPVVRAAIAELAASGYDVVAAAMLGGTEKVDLDAVADYGVPLVGGDDPAAALVAGLDRHGPSVVFDLADEPVVDARTRLGLVSRTLARGVDYHGADFTFAAPRRPRLSSKPSVAVVGTGKRTGKTAVSAHLARLLAQRGTPPVIVAMGRGGPLDPEVVDPSTFEMTPASLLALVDGGRHAASDHLEGALMARVATIGTRRAGGGMAGAPASATFASGVALANERPEVLTVFEGSGAVAPPAHADATVLVVPAGADPELVTGYLGLHRLLMADAVVVTLAEQSLSPAAHALEDRIRELVPGIPLVRTTFRPHPLEPLSGRAIFFATTAPSAVAAALAGHLETGHGARVVGTSSNLAHRKLLHKDLQAAEGAEVLVTELKAAAVDVATRLAVERGMHVIYCDNRPVGCGDEGAVDALLLAVADRACERHSAFETDQVRPR